MMLSTFAVRFSLLILLVVVVVNGDTKEGGMRMMTTQSPAVGAVINRSSWMGSLSPLQRARPLREWILPGSHDSATYTLNISATPPMQDEMYQILLDLAEDPITAPLARGPIDDLTLTQAMPIAAQLQLGIRAFDLRLTYNPNTGAFYFSHSFVAVDADATMQSVVTFLREHPSELILMQLTSDWEHRNQTDPWIGAWLSRIVFDVAGPGLLVPSNITSLGPEPFGAPGMSIESLTTAGHQLMLFADVPQTSLSGSSKSHNVTSFVWPASGVNGFWPNGQDVNESVSRIDEYVFGTNGTTIQNSSVSLNLIFFTITPDEASIVQNVVDHLGNLTNMTSLHDYAVEMRPPTDVILSRVFGGDSADWKQINVVSMDWPEASLIDRIISYNTL